MTPSPALSPTRERSHSRNQSLSEAVLVPQTVLEEMTTACNGDRRPTVDEASVDLAEHHEALIGDEFRNPTNIMKQPTLATLGETPFADDGEEIEHHRIVATEIVNSLRFDQPDTILQNAIVLLDP